MILFHVFSIQCFRWGLALKRVRDLVATINDGKIPSDTTYDAVLQESVNCLDQLGWTHLSKNHRNWIKVSVKAEYDPF